MHFAGPLLLRECVVLRAYFGPVGLNPLGYGICIVIISWFIPICTSMSYPISVGHSSGRDCGGYCLGSL